MLDAQFTIIPNVFSFRVSQNIHLGWMWNRIDFMMPLHFAVTISVVVIFIITIVHRYFAFLTLKWEKYHCIPNILLILGLSAGFCKLIDDVFWGGSLDYIQLFDWFIFDLKDVYLTIAAVVSAYFCIAYEFYHRKLPKEKQKEQKFMSWVKSGLP